MGLTLLVTMAEGEIEERLRCSGTTGGWKSSSL